MTKQIQNEQNIAISKHLTKSAEYTRTTSGALFSANVWISGGEFFHYKTCYIPLEDFASKFQMRLQQKQILVLTPRNPINILLSR